MKTQRRVPREKEYDWFGFWVRFVFGLIGGLIIGIIAFSDGTICPREIQLSESMWPFLIWECVFGMIGAFVYGYTGDRWLHFGLKYDL